MKLYELTIERNLNFAKKGDIWLTSGRFVRPEDYKKDDSDPAFGYCLDDGLAVGLRKSLNVGTWSNSQAASEHNSLLGKASEHDGYLNSESIRNSPNFHLVHGTIIHECLNIVNAGIRAYLPSISELLKLYSSIMYGPMMDDLCKVKIYDLCNYRYISAKLSDDRINEWSHIWSSTESKKNPSAVWSIGPDGMIKKDLKKVHRYYTIPFFKIY